LSNKKPIVVLTHGEYIKLYEKLPDQVRYESEMEKAIKELAKLLVAQEYIEAPSQDVEVIPYGRKYIIMHGSNELYHIE
jgi:glutathione synthase/RimK-type ligase-like ATP-grasp enzyme